MAAILLAKTFKREVSILRSSTVVLNLNDLNIDAILVPLSVNPREMLISRTRNENMPFVGRYSSIYQYSWSLNNLFLGVPTLQLSNRSSSSLETVI